MAVLREQGVLESAHIEMAAAFDAAVSTAATCICRIFIRGLPHHMVDSLAGRLWRFPTVMSLAAVAVGLRPRCLMSKCVRQLPIIFRSDALVLGSVMAADSANGRAHPWGWLLATLCAQ